MANITHYPDVDHLLVFLFQEILIRTAWVNVYGQRVMPSSPETEDIKKIWMHLDHEQ